MNSVSIQRTVAGRFNKALPMVLFYRGVITLILMLLLALVLAGNAWANAVGPVYPPPFGVTFSASGTANDGGIALPGGKTFTFSGALLADRASTYWGPSSIKLSFVSSAYNGPGEVMSIYNYDLNSMEWRGSTTLNGTSYQTRCRITESLNPAQTVVGSTSIPGLVRIMSSSVSWQATLYMEVYDTAGYVSLTNWVPAYSFYNNSHVGAAGGAYSSFTGGFWYDNSAPLLNLNGVGFITMAAGSTAGPFPVVVSDDVTDPGLVTFSTTSDTPAVLPTNQITFGGSGSNRTVSVKTQAGVAGFVYATVQGLDTDGGASGLYGFQVLSDTPPTVSHISDQFIQMNPIPQTVHFSISDALNQPLMLYGISSNETLIPKASINFGGASSDTTLTFLPNANQYGVVKIGVLVSNQVSSTASTFTVTVNAQPYLLANNQITVNQNATVPVTTNFLQAFDPDNTTAQVIFTVNPDGGGGPPHEGFLLKSGVPLTSGSTFTEADLENGLISYQHSGSCQPSDDFQFGVTDPSGGVLSDSGHTVFSFRFFINPMLVAPIALDSSNSVPIGGSINGTLTAINTDCANQNLNFNIITQPQKGFLQLNPAGGGYTYVANGGQSGSDSFKFKVSNGPSQSTNTGTVFITIQNQPPVATPTNFNVVQGSVFSNSLAGTDPDLPAQHLSFTILTNGTRGTATLLNGASNGAFTYTPQAMRFGTDSFTFKVNDGITDSAPATVSVIIKPTVAYFGDLVMAGGSPNGVVLFNPTNGDSGLLFTGAPLNSPNFLTVDALGTILIADQSAGVVGIDTIGGTQTALIPSSNYPSAIGVARLPNGNIIVTHPQTGSVDRFNSAGVFQTNFVSSVSGFSFTPAGVAVTTNGQVLVVNAGFFGGSPSSNAVLALDPVTLKPTARIALGQLLTSPVGIAVEPTGNLLVAQLQDNAIVRITLPGGVQTTLTNGGTLNQPAGLAVDLAGNIYVANSGSGVITKVNPVNGQQTVVTVPGGLSSPFGIAVAGVPVAPVTLKNVKFVGGQPQINFAGYPGTPYTVWQSASLNTPLTNWSSMGTATETSPGNFTFTDTAVLRPTTKFYNVRFP